MTNPVKPQRFSRLGPFSLQERIKLATVILGFFNPINYDENIKLLGRQPTPGRSEPLDGGELLTYLELTGILPNPRKYMVRLGELLRRLEASGLLTSYGQGRDIFLGKQYYSIKELTSLERNGLLWLAPALGADFIHYIYSDAIVHITGSNKKGDIHSGTGIIIHPNWILTCAHVINDMRVDEEQIFGDKPYRITSTLAHPTVDVGLIQVAAPLTVLRSQAFRDPYLCESLFTLGFPRVPLSRAPHLVMQRGEVTTTDVVLFDGSEVFLYSAIARPGNSGGPIISSSGHIVGIVTEELTEKSENPNTPFHAGIRASTIREAIQELQPTIDLPFEDWE